MNTSTIGCRSSLSCFMLFLMLHLAAQAQNLPADPSQPHGRGSLPALREISDSRWGGCPERVWSSKNVMSRQDYGELQGGQRVPSYVAAGAAVRGVEWIEQDRGAVYNQPGEFVRVSVKWSSSTAIKGMRVNKDGVTKVQLFDDGTHGDTTPGDGVWTLDSLSIYSPTASSMYRLAKDSKYGCAVNRWLSVEWQLADGTWENDGYAYVRVGFVDPLSSFEVQKLARGLWATEYCLFVEDSLQTERTFPGYPVTDQTWSYLMKPASNLLFAHLPDAFDFLVVTPATPLWLPNPVLMERVPNASNVKNDVEGIGMTLFDNTAGWGTAGRLRTVVYHSNGPFTLLAHELGHRWMAYYDSLTFSNGACGVHWAENQTIGGNMSLWPKIVETAPGIFKGVMQHMPDAFNASYSNLDLYLMGVKPLTTRTQSGYDLLLARPCLGFDRDRSVLVSPFVCHKRPGRGGGIDRRGRQRVCALSKLSQSFQSIHNDIIHPAWSFNCSAGGVQCARPAGRNTCER
jgi:hypothetical protein